jgi:hypothetical protein
MRASTARPRCRRRDHRVHPDCSADTARDADIELEAADSAAAAAGQHGQRDRGARADLLPRRVDCEAFELAGRAPARRRKAAPATRRFEPADHEHLDGGRRRRARHCVEVGHALDLRTASGRRTGSRELCGRRVPRNLAPSRATNSLATASSALP